MKTRLIFLVMLLASVNIDCSYNECSICATQLYNNQQDVITLSCHETHSFHLYCLYQWNKRQLNCPLCRSSTQSDPPHIRFSSYTAKEKEETEVSCLDTFRELFCNRYNRNDLLRILADDALPVIGYD